jgi:acetaldehyde dehydrogenase (acetylating)
MALDLDLNSIQQSRELVRKAKQAQEAFSNYSEQAIEKILLAMVDATEKNAEWLARMAVDETGYGVFEHKIIKNRFAATDVYNAIKNIKTTGVIREDKEQKLVEVAVPVGVVMALTPTTNPTSTVIHNAICAVKAGNAIVFSPHPKAVRCSNAAVEMLQQAAQKAGAPENLISSLSLMTMQATEALMKNDDIAVIIATGGSAMVKAAYSAGKPALGVGPGNVPVYIERTANIKQAVQDIFTSKTFDNGMICASEQAIIVDSPVEDAVIAEIKAQGGYFMDKSEVEKVTRVLMTPKGGMNAAWVGQSAAAIAKQAGVSAPAGVRLLVAPLAGHGQGYPLSFEKLSPVVAFYKVNDWHEACMLSIELLKLGGIGHTFSIHSENDQVIREFIRKPVFRILVNTPSALGGIGYSTSLLPSLTLGCGTWGGSSISENMGPQHLINIKRLAYSTRRVSLDTGEKCDPSCAVSADDIADIVRQVIKQLPYASR